MTALVARLGAALLAKREGSRAIMVTDPGSPAAAHLEALTGRGRVFAHPPWEAGLGASTAVHVELSDVDEDLVVPRAVLWPGGQAMVRRRRRRIDTLYGDGARAVGLIALVGGEAPAGVLRGADRVRERWRPWLLVDLRRAVAVDRGQWLDAGSAEVAPGMFCSPDPGALMLPASEPPGVTAFDDRLVCVGLHAPEWDAPAGGRWTGAAYATWFALARPAAGQWRLVLQIADWGTAGAEITASIEGEILRHRAVSGNAVAFGPIDIGAADDVIRVRLLLPRPVADLERWPRRIGVRILAASWEAA